MGNGNSERVGKFYWEQIEQIRSLLARYVKEADSKFDYDKYLLVCEQLGEEPDPAKMPLEPSSFPEEVQVAFFMFSLLTDRWDGMSGSYLGKSWEGVEYFFKTYDIQDPGTVIYIMKLYEGIIVSHKAEKAEQERKAEERRRKSASGGGKTYTHNVRG